MADAEALVARLEPFDAICVMRERTPLPRSVLERLPSLRFIASTGARNASIDLEAARDFNITVSSTGANGSGAPELTWALILAAARQIPAEVESLQSGGWQTTVGRDLNGSTLGIIGLGRIGSQIARVAIAENSGAMFSPEALPEFDADVIFDTFRNDRQETARDAKKRMEALMPDYCRFLRACREGRYYFLPRDEAKSTTYAARMMAIAVLTGIISSFR